MHRLHVPGSLQQFDAPVGEPFFRVGPFDVQAFGLRITNGHEREFEILIMLVRVIGMNQRHAHIEREVSRPRTAVPEIVPGRAVFVDAPGHVRADAACAVLQHGRLHIRAGDSFRRKAFDKEVAAVVRDKVVRVGVVFVHGCFDRSNATGANRPDSFFNGNRIF